MMTLRDRYRATLPERLSPDESEDDFARVTVRAAGRARRTGRVLSTLLAAASIAAVAVLFHAPGPQPSGEMEIYLRVSGEPAADAIDIHLTLAGGVTR